MLSLKYIQSAVSAEKKKRLCVSIILESTPPQEGPLPESTSFQWDAGVRGGFLKFRDAAHAVAQKYENMLNSRIANWRSPEDGTGKRASARS